jgi:hypothetical protein
MTQNMAMDKQKGSACGLTLAFGIVTDGRQSLR